MVASAGGWRFEGRDTGSRNGHAFWLQLAKIRLSPVRGLCVSAPKIRVRRGTHAVAQVLSELAQSDEFRAFPALAPDRVASTTGFFLDSVVGPLMVRAHFG
jgi:hypothetical protein